MGSSKLAFTEEEKAIDENLGYPKAYAKLCKSPNLLGPYIHGPPFTFLPYVLQPQEALKIKEVNEMFPVKDPEAVPSANPRGFVNLLWKQLDHLGNAGFDPALFRVDPYGNVLYLHADSASPLSWEIDHWFPCERGGKTVPSNLRIVQAQMRKKKGHKLEFLIPWWDLQIGISVNQFLSIFASKDSDYRKRAFSFLFADGGNEELNAVQSVEAHAFPHHFNEAKEKSGLAPAAVVSVRRSDMSVLKPVDINRSTRPTYPVIASAKFPALKDNRTRNPNISKENSNPNIESDTYSTNPHLSIAMARDSLRQRDEAKKKQQAELDELDGEIEELKERNEEERVGIQDLEEFLIKKKRRAERCRHLAEAQAQYKLMLEKMIRDAMHLSVVYKEQLRLNQAANSALMARLEAQRSICDSSETELRRKFKQRDELETQIKQFSDKPRKRSRVEDNNATFSEARQDLRNRFSSRKHGRNPLTKELRVFLEEEQRVSEAGEENLTLNKNRVRRRFSLVERGSSSVNDKLETLSIRDLNDMKGKRPLLQEPPYKLDVEKLQRHTIDSVSKTEVEEEQVQEHMNEIGRGNVDKWLQMLISDSQEDPSTDKITAASTEIERANSESDLKQTETSSARKSFHASEKEERKVVGLPAMESTRAFRSLPSSPSSVISGMRKGVDCIARKPKVIGEDEEYGYLDCSVSGNHGKFMKAIKKALIK